MVVGRARGLALLLATAVGLVLSRWVTPRIGAFGPLRFKAQKLEGFRHAHRVDSLSLDEGLLVEPQGFSMEAGFAAMKILAARASSLMAVFASSDMFALGVMRWANLNGLRVP